MNPSISLLGTLDIHRRDQAVLRPEEDTGGTRKMNPSAGVGEALGCTFDNKVNFMRCWAPNAQDIMLCVGTKAGDKAGMAASHGILPIRGHIDELEAPWSVKRVMELDNHVKDDKGSVAVKRTDGNKVNSCENAPVTEPHAHVKE
jgi:hypothetical protein